ncbi:MAG TPA: hypothetical protein VE288_11200 [Rubrobacteraceae bacterium]|nr:hypothetical protein [Rubrobacteraceae bacterium]
MKKLLYLVAAALVAMLILVPSAFAQGTVKTEATVERTIEAPLPPSGGGVVGGPAVVLPAAAALLLGSGVMAYAVLRRRR